MGGSVSKAMGGLPFALPLVRLLTQLTVLGRIFGNKEMRLLMLGLDAAGKTSMWCCN